jgi:hypothetical protein
VCGYVVFAPCRRIGIAILDEHKADELTGSWLNPMATKVT